MLIAYCVWENRSEKRKGDLLPPAPFVQPFNFLFSLSADGNKWTILKGERRRRSNSQEATNCRLRRRRTTGSPGGALAEVQESIFLGNGEGEESRNIDISPFFQCFRKAKGRR